MPCCRVLPGAPSYAPTAFRLYPTGRPVMKLVGALVLLAAIGALARLTLFLDIEKFREDLPMPADLYGQMAQRTHRGDGPCLRYIAPGAVPAEEWTRTVADAEASGVAESLVPLWPLFLRWAEEADAPHHASDQA